MWWSNANAFQAKRPPGRRAAATRSKTRRRSAHVGRWRSERNGAVTSAAGSSSAKSRMSTSLSSSSTRPCPRLPGDGEHRRRGVDSDHPLPRPLGDRDRDAPRPDGELHDRPVRLGGERDVEVDVLGHVRRPDVVDRREGVVGAHGARFKQPGARVCSRTMVATAACVARLRGPGSDPGQRRASSPPSFLAISVAGAARALTSRAKEERCRETRDRSRYSRRRGPEGGRGGRARGARRGRRRLTTSSRSASSTSAARAQLKLALRDVRDRETGMALNTLRERLETAIDAREEELGAPSSIAG